MLQKLIRDRWIREYIGAAIMTAVMVILSASVLWGYLLPKGKEIDAIRKRIAPLEQQEKEYKAAVAKTGISGHTHSHGHTHGLKKEEKEDPFGFEARTRGLKVLAMEKDTGTEAFQLKILDGIAVAAGSTWIEDFKYQRLLDASEKVATIDRKEKTGPVYQEEVYRNLFTLDMEGDYKGISDILKKIDDLDDVITIKDIRLSKGGDEGLIRAQMTLESYQTKGKR